MSDMPNSLPSAPAIDAPILESTTGGEVPPTPEELKAKYVKYAMKNMVKKGSKSLQHFFLSAAGLLALFVTLAYLTR